MTKLEWLGQTVYHTLLGEYTYICISHDVITHLEPDILECEVKWALGSITMNKANWRGWNSSWAISNPKRWCCESDLLNMPENLENSTVAIRLEKVSFHSNLKERQCQRMIKLPHNCILLTQCKVMLKILQARLQQYMNRELPDIQAGFRKGRGNRDQIA